MTKNNIGTLVEPITLEPTRRIYRNAEHDNDDRFLGHVNADNFAECYLNEDRATLNEAILNRNLPAEHPKKDKRYETIAAAYRKLVYDAEFYVDDWDDVKEVLRWSPYLTQF